MDFGAAHSMAFDATRRANPIPQVVRNAVMKRAGGVCEDCGGSAFLELHHCTYYRHELPEIYYIKSSHEVIFGYETPDDLLALCRDCHLAKHIDPYGQFRWDPEECEEEWNYWHHITGKDD